MKTVAARTFKSQCKQGKPVAKLISAEPDKEDNLFGLWEGRVKITGDIVTPVFDLADFDMLK